MTVRTTLLCFVFAGAGALLLFYYLQLRGEDVPVAAEGNIESECNSCTARHKDKIRLRDLMSTEPEAQK